MKTQLQEKRTPTVKVGRSRQIVIPKKIHDVLDLKPGDLLDVELQKGKVIFTPKTLIDKRLAEAMEDIKQGRSYGPFTNADEAIRFLHRQVKQAKRKTS